MSPTEVQDLVENHLQQQLVKHFDPAKADTVFQSEDGTPEWLEEMIKYKKWRQLFYQLLVSVLIFSHILITWIFLDQSTKLIEKYPDCILLNYVIKLISDAGHQGIVSLFFPKNSLHLGEITNLSTAAAQLEVFARVIKTSIEKLLDENDETIIENLPKFCEMVNHSEHTYLFSQGLLAEISRKSKNNHLIRRISQEVELFARQRGYQINTAWLSSIPGATKYPKAMSKYSDFKPSVITTIVRCSERNTQRSKYNRRSPVPVHSPLQNVPRQWPTSNCPTKITDNDRHFCQLPLHSSTEHSSK